MKNSVAELEKSFVVASELQKKELQELVNLCSHHENLLSVEHAIEDEKDPGTAYLVTEVVFTVEEFFRLEYQKFLSAPREKPLTSLSEEEKFDLWWEQISGFCWSIFRDVSRALLYLFVKTDYSCGDLSFNTFVTCDGRGRILPTLDSNKKPNEDVRQLQLLMKSAIYPFGTRFPKDLVLPFDLKSFLDDVHSSDAAVPPFFKVDHPYFWNASERVDFAPRVKKLIKTSGKIENTVDGALNLKHFFLRWGTVLKDGVYKAIYDKPSSEGSDVQRYTKCCDIARFFNASYHHVNDNEYKRFRLEEDEKDKKDEKDEKDKKDKLKPKKTDLEIEEDLRNLFPHFYSGMFSALWFCVSNRSLAPDLLKGISSVYSRDFLKDK